MKNLLKLSIKALLLITLLVIPVSSAVLADEGDFNIQVSPNVLNLESNGGCISVHTDIAGIPEEVILNIGENEFTDISLFTDSCGNLVVRCTIDAIDDFVVVGDAVFFLTGKLNGKDFTTNPDTMSVIQVIPQKP